MRIAVLGATGYTGRLIAAELAQDGHTLLLAGRSEQALRELSSALPGEHQTLAVDVRDEARLEMLARRCTVLVNCAGPFTTLGPPVARLAARHGLRYLDLTNELGYAHSIASTLDELSQASGAVLVPSCGLEVAVSDCLAALLARDLPAPLAEAHVIYRLPGMGSSYGTRASALLALETSWVGWRGGRFVPDQPCRRTRTATLDGRLRHALSFPSCETVTLPRHLPLRDVHTWVVASRAAMWYGPWLIAPLLSLLPGPLGWAMRLTSRGASRPPDERTRRAMPFALRVELGADASAAAELSGLDPYGLTAPVVAVAAAALLDYAGPPGVRAPSEVIDPATLLARLERCGVQVTLPAAPAR